jgi:hypothetical protein
VAEQGFEVAVVPPDRAGRPGTFQAAADGVGAAAAAKAALPAEPLLLDAGALGFRADVLARVGGAMAFAEGVSAGGEGHGLLVVHGHACEGLPHVARGAERVGVAIGPFRVHVDQAHLHRGQRVVQLALAAVALITQPLAFGAPVDVVFGFPDVGATAGEAEGLQAHRFQRHGAGQHDEVGPGQVAAVLLLDRPDQAARLVQAHVVGPAVQRRKPLRPGARTAAAIGDAVGAGAVPGHADEVAGRSGHSPPATRPASRSSGRAGRGSRPPGPGAGRPRRS